MFFSEFVVLRPLDILKEKSTRWQNAFNVHNSSAANLCTAKHNNFIFPSSGNKTRVEKMQGDRWQNQRHVPTALDRFVQYSEILSFGCAAWIKIKRATFGNAIVQKQAQWAIEGRNPDECEPASGPLNMRTQALSAYWARMEDRLSWEPDNLAHRTRISSAWGPCEHQIHHTIVNKKLHLAVKKSRVKRATSSSRSHQFGMSLPG